MKQVIESFFRIVLFAIILTIWWLVLNAQLSNVMNLSIIVGGVLLTFPLVWLGRKILPRCLDYDVCAFWFGFYIRCSYRTGISHSS
jgi:hypothetical protein